MGQGLSRQRLGSAGQIGSLDPASVPQRGARTLCRFNQPSPRTADDAGCNACRNQTPTIGACRCVKPLCVLWRFLVVRQDRPGHNEILLGRSPVLGAGRSPAPRRSLIERIFHSKTSNMGLAGGSGLMPVCQWRRCTDLMALAFLADGRSDAPHLTRVRTSPAANTAGTPVSNGNGVRASAAQVSPRSPVPQLDVRADKSRERRSPRPSTAPVVDSGPMEAEETAATLLGLLVARRIRSVVMSVSEVLAPG